VPGVAPAHQLSVVRLGEDIEVAIVADVGEGDPVDGRVGAEESNALRDARAIVMEIRPPKLSVETVTRG
jgi:hypothetical protein